MIRLLADVAAVGVGGTHALGEKQAARACRDLILSSRAG
jgi:hypothetical protein